MKGIGLFCSSSASTAIASCLNPRSSACRGAAIKRYTTGVGRKSQLGVPCRSSSQLSIINPTKQRTSSKDKQKRKSSLKLKSLCSHSSSDDSSTRYLLSDVPFTDWFSESDHKITATDPVQHSEKPKAMNTEDASFLTSSQDRIVVLRVSLHSKACEGKVRKHISRMEGVTSFSIDMEAKKVTIMGHVTSLGGLASVSKVKKNAQLWPSTLLPS